MMEKKSLIKMGATLALVGAVGVGSTLAYLQTETKEVKNTFAVGEYSEDFVTGFTFDEVQVTRDEETGNYVKDNTVTERVQTNTYDKVLPGTTLTKDPTVKITEEAPFNSYVIVKVEGVDKALGELNGKLMTKENEELHSFANGDLKKVTKDSKFDGYYYYELDEKETWSHVLFDHVAVSSQFDGEITEDDLKMNFEAGVIQRTSGLTPQLAAQELFGNK